MCLHASSIILVRHPSAVDKPLADSFLPIISFNLPPGVKGTFRVFPTSPLRNPVSGYFPSLADFWSLICCLDRYLCFVPASNSVSSCFFLSRILFRRLTLYLASYPDTLTELEAGTKQRYTTA